MSKPRPFLVGVLVGSMALSPTGLALAQQPAGGPDAIAVRSGGIEALLVDKKDAGLKRALLMLDDRVNELPAETGEDDMPAGMFSMILNNLISPMSFSFGMDEQPAQGAAPFHAQLVVHSIEPGAARDVADLLTNKIAEQGGEWSPGPVGGVQTTDGPVGEVLVGATQVGGREALVLGLNALNLEARPLDASGLLPNGVTPAFVVHADMQRVTPLMQMAMQHPDAAMVAQMLESAGMMGTDAMIIDAALGQGADRMYGGAVYRGYAKIAPNWGVQPGKAISVDVLRSVPIDATSVRAGMMNLSRLADTIRMFAQQAGEDRDPFEVLAEDLGFNPDTDLLAHLGDTFLVYQSDATGGGGLMSTVAMLTLKDAPAFARTHEKIKTRINQVGARQGRGYVRIESWNDGGMNGFTLRTPGLPVPLELSWTIAGDRIVAGATPLAVRAALAQMRAPKSSILDNKKVVEMAGGRLDDVMSLEYVDTPRFVRQGYAVASLAASAIGNAVRSPGDQSRDPGQMMLPFNEFVDGVQPTVVAGRWKGDDLVYTMQSDRSMLVNIAGAGGAMGGITGVMALGAVAGALLPALHKARAAARRVEASVSLRTVGSGVVTLPGNEGAADALGIPEGMRP